LQGYSYSTDAGQHFTDGTFPPVPPVSGWRWLSDPVVTVDEKSGAFYYGALGLIGSTANGIAVARATFSGSNIQWSTPHVVRQAGSEVILDKPWIAADSVNGNVYVIYTAFRGPNGDSDTIDVQVSTDGGATWSDPKPISSANDAGGVQGARVQIGPS